MIYLYWYLGVGAVVLVLIAAFHKFTTKKDDNSLNDVLADLRPERKPLWYRFVNDVLGPALVGTLIVPFWAVIVFFKVKHAVFGEPVRASVDEPEFAVTRGDLQTQLSLQEVERQEMVFDPLGAAPNVPFGHLNTAWRKFCESMEPQDCLWSFTANWTISWGGKDFRQGYVIVRREEIGRHFMTVRKDIEEDADQETVSGKRTDGFDIPGCLRKHAD